MQFKTRIKLCVSLGNEVDLFCIKKRDKRLIMLLYKIFCIQIIYNNAIKPCFSNSLYQSEKAKAKWMKEKNLLKNKKKCLKHH